MLKDIENLPPSSVGGDGQEIKMTTTAPSAMKRLLTVDEACAALSLSRAKVYELLMKDELRSITIGRARRVPIEAIDDFIRDRAAIA